MPELQPFVSTRRQKVRRIVTGHGTKGRPVIAADAHSPKGYGPAYSPIATV